MLALRVASTIVAVPVLLALIRLGGYGLSIGLGFLLACAALEFYAMTNARPGNPHPLAAAVPRLLRPLATLLAQDTNAFLGAALVALLVAGAHAGGRWWPGSLAAAAIVGWAWLIVQGQTQDALHHWLRLTGGVVYIGWLGSHMVWLRKLDADGDWLLISVGAAFMADTAAYFVGHAVGRRPLAPSISPGKTVEGTLGAIAAGWGGVMLLNYATGVRLAWELAVPMGALVGLAAPLGDLAESLLKRSAGVKDAGSILPGHGGLLDRLDSVLFVAVVVYYYALWATQ